jgi:small subunit ribosomal protein S20
MPAPSKRDRQSLKKYEQNKPVRTHLKNLSRSFYRAVESGDTERAQQIRDEAQKEYNKAATKGVIHPNKASRKTSRFDKALVGSRSPE